MALPDERQEPVTDEFDDDIHEVPSHTPDFRTELAEELARLVPEAVADGKIDVEKVRELLDEDAANDGRERFGLMWPGKARALKAAQAPTTATLVPDRENSKDWDTTQNVFIEGDNLEVLKVLQKHYHGKIQMIYIDPPYNTGNDFIYPDNFKEGLQTYLEWTRQITEEGRKLSSNPESEGRFHSNWLNMMYPRLKLARNLLSEDGVLFVSIDDAELNNLIQLVREIFGESNLFPVIAVEMSKTQGMKVAAAQKGQIVKNHEYLVGVAKSWDLANIDRTPLFDNSELYDDHYDTILLGGKEPIRLEDFLASDKSSVEAFSNLGLPVSKANLKTLLYLKPDFHDYFVREIGPNLFRESPISLDSVQRLEFNSGEILRYEKYLLKKNSRGKIVQLQAFSDGVRKSDDYVPREARSTIRGALWKGFHSDMMNVGREGGVQFKNGKKPVRLIKQIAKWVNRKDSIVLDFFSGSGTTGHAIMELNAEDGGSRRHIQVQLPEPLPVESEAEKEGFDSIADLTRQRIRLSGEAVCQQFAAFQSSRQSALDIGFRSYKLSETSFVKWRETSATDQNTLEQRLAGLRGSADDNATPEMLLTELLLKQGYSLTERVSETEIAGLRVWSVAEGAMLAIMDEHVKPSLEQLRAVVESGPVRLVILEDVFVGDDQLKTNLVQYAKTHGVELWSA